ncbi:hypothetical protein [Phytohabitans kaempferiae]|uniref:Metallo-beta-lactamase domain-containing protein n=1 Tax=Phytohabitans kaempferiae TaxID=1620943 RepID=A0ABV6LXQ9_9ACTN
MRLRMLGTAAGGGVPQWNCACDGCAAARAAGVSRTQDCVALSGDGRHWYLLNASPDLRAQILATPELAPGPGRRETPIRGGPRAVATVVGSKRPRYAAASGGADWVVAYRITDPRTGGTLVYAPRLPALVPSLVDGADCAVLDGTFLREDEMVVGTGGGRTASAMGHLPVAASRRALPPRPGRRLLYTHLNNTNPLAVGGGEDVAEDGLTLTL